MNNPTFSLESPKIYPKQLSQTPNIWWIPNFLPIEYCNHLIRISQEQLTPSLGFDVESGESHVVEIRTSSQVFLERGQDSVVSAIESRIEQLTKIPVDHGEGLQILRYQVGEEYKAHFDYFDPRFPGSQVSLERGGQRVATVIMYLNDNIQGGETAFPLLNLSLKPEQGSALLFYSIQPDGEIDKMTLHSSVPVTEGEKWVATKWLRQGVFI